MNGFGNALKDISDLLTADRFRQELQAFLDANNLPSETAARPEKWKRFMENYLESITDVALEIKPLPVKYVQSVSISQDTEMANGKLYWKVKLLDNPNPILMPFRI